jgi:CBS domain-containing protein
MVQLRSGEEKARAMRNVSINRVMTPAPATVEPTTGVAAAERLMRASHCHHLPVVAGGRVVGIVARLDLLKALVLRPDAEEADSGLPRRGSLQSRHVADVMQHNPRVLTQTSTLLDAARALGTGGFHALPVVSADEQLVGIVTSTDVMQALADELQHAGADEQVEASAAEASADDVTDPQVHALREVYRAVRNYLNSGQAESEHSRLLLAAERARAALRDAHIEI